MQLLAARCFSRSWSYSQENEKLKRIAVDLHGPSPGFEKLNMGLLADFWHAEVILDQDCLKIRSLLFAIQRSPYGV